MNLYVLVRTLEKAKLTGSFNIDLDIKDSFNETESDTSDIEGSLQQRKSKKIKVCFCMEFHYTHSLNG